MRALGSAMGVWLAAAAAFAQGPLTPPGAPAAGMRTLAQIEPRIPITNVNTTISQPGSYYLTTNLVAAIGQSGIIIQSGGVTVDLMGHTLTGAGIEAAQQGISINGATNRHLVGVVVRNGTIASFGYGVRASYASGLDLENLNVFQCYNPAINLYGYGAGNFIRNGRIFQCNVSSNGSSGLFLNGSGGGLCSGVLVKDCVIGNNGAGIYVWGSSGNAYGNVICDTVIHGNRGYGIFVNGEGGICDGNVIRDSCVSSNISQGIYFSGSGGGRVAGNAVEGCVLNDNQHNGIDLEYASGNRIAHNQIRTPGAATRYGIQTSSCSQNLVVCNFVVGPTNHYQITSNDTYGPIVTNRGALATTGADAHPWANFAR